MDKTKIHLGIMPVDPLELREVYRRRCKELGLLPNLKSGRRAMDQLMLAAIRSSPHYPGINALLDDLEPGLEEFRVVSVYREDYATARKLFEEDRKRAFSNLRSRANEDSIVVVEYQPNPYPYEILQFGNISDAVACLRVIASSASRHQYTVLNELEQSINGDTRGNLIIKAVNFEEIIHS